MEDFYALFDRTTSNGRVLEVDLSDFRGTLPTRSLTGNEAAARRRWNAMIVKGGANSVVRQHYKGKTRIVSSRTALLSERVCPPQFVETNPSPRYGSKRRKPKSPGQIQVWQHFKDLVSNFNPGESQQHALEGDVDDDVFMRSLNSGTVVRDEKDEFVYVREHVFRRLRDARLIDYRDDQQIPRQGLPDFLLGKRDDDDNWQPTLASEFKASHSLPLPMPAENVVECHNIGKCAGQNSMKRAYKKRVCYPIGQLLRYMSSNGLRVGALSCASRTYFFLIQDRGGKVGDIVNVSEALFLGERDYLRAWAYCYHLGCTLDRYDPDQVEWADSDSEFGGDSDDGEDTRGAASEKHNQGSLSPKDASDRGSSNRGIATRHSKRLKASGESGSTLRTSVIPWVPFSSVSIELNHPLGYGRNGCVFRGSWGSQPVAVKQFDLAVPGVFERAQKEISAYERLKACQGTLIPKAHFLSESKYGILYFGLQLGRRPEPQDDVGSWGRVVEELRREHCFQHDDADGRNGLLIPDGDSGERLVAIDLEEHEFVCGNK